MSKSDEIKAAHKALRERCDHRAGDEERFDAHVGEARDGAGGVVGVQGAEHQVAGQAGTDGHFGGFEIADFSDEHDVGVVAQHRPERVRESEIYLRLDLYLRNSFKLIFYRVFYGNYLFVRGIYLAERRV